MFNYIKKLFTLKRDRDTGVKWLVKCPCGWSGLSCDCRGDDHYNAHPDAYLCPNCNGLVEHNKVDVLISYYECGGDRAALDRIVKRYFADAV
ncbi:hypothetical protein [Aestuariispira insulae]|uniref:Uncharacterized protein n=1 Tax=Aestuariispira insulae TaxID=1461337 RepID=A0A3D9H3U1_9PROT|nr:hypothetical protein [Aestuariispira insulae]RED44132.1 hypothetical protein DFP90_11735 [Aestuariispira insulae]